MVLENVKTLLEYAGKIKNNARVAAKEIQVIERE
jgi:hypothetical protein